MNQALAVPRQLWIVSWPDDVIKRQPEAGFCFIRFSFAICQYFSLIVSVFFVLSLYLALLVPAKWLLRKNGILHQSNGWEYRIWNDLSLSSWILNTTTCILYCKLYYNFSGCLLTQTNVWCCHLGNTFSQTIQFLLRFKAKWCGFLPKLTQNA